MFIKQCLFFAYLIDCFREDDESLGENSIFLLVTRQFYVQNPTGNSEPQNTKMFKKIRNNPLYISMFSLKVEELAREKSNASSVFKNFLK